MPETKFREIADQLAAEFGALPPGSKVAGEHEIAERFGVGRAAARAALQELQRRMLVRRIKGDGTYTAKRIDYVISSGRAPSWSRTVREAGSVPRSVVRSCEVVPMPELVADRLGRQVGEPCFRLRRRSFTDGLPASWGDEWVPVDVVPQLATAIRHEPSLHEILRQMAEAEPERASSRASIEVATDEVADELECTPGDPVWLVESVNRDARSGRLLCFTQRWIRSDAMRVLFELVAPAAATAAATPTEARR
ncbi:GntR family transcriptional regulator [Agromyces salentinus]|uniref:HTH gntR-type domain-containing protein n=1 Tax=Agromyces salentinus TaxID=269421 RepID=A0ABN2MIT8_9MICO|nr:GntR family transcriptional regulator [Agromyces salentinus]